MVGKDQIKNFLLVYNRRDGVLEQERDFGSDVEAAIAAYQELEREHREDGAYDIVLVGSDSIESVRVTHANYFGDRVDSLEDYLTSVLMASGTPVVR